MAIAERVLHPKPLDSLDDYVEHLGGGSGLRSARSMDPWALIELIEASGLRGRGGAGFPTGTKWRTVRENLSESLPAAVVVNGAEGEPGTFKDRALLRGNPYHVLEGALIAAHAVSAVQVVVALKQSFGTELTRVRAAIEEAKAAGWADGVELVVLEGPDEYLYGEETALLEVLAGRPPFPRIAPPFRRGATDVVETTDDVDSGSGLSAHVEMAGADIGSDAPPALVDNVETLANVPGIVAQGADWFRAVGTRESPGTIVCTITGQVQNPGVGEIAMGTTLRTAIDEIAGGALPGCDIIAIMPGVSSSIIPASLLDTPLTYEDMAAIGSGLGSAGYVVLDDSVDPVAAVAGASRFLAIESCGQCLPCKQDGLALGDLLTVLAASEATDEDLATIREKVTTVADGARCSIGAQHQAVVNGLLTHFAEQVNDHLGGTAPPQPPVEVAEIIDITGTAVELDERRATKQPDWSYEPTWDGQSPVDMLTDHRSGSELDS